MEFSKDVVSQVILLASILGGFSLTTATQIALKDETSERERTVANSLVISFLSCLTVIVLGIINLSLHDQKLKSAVAGGIVMTCLILFFRFLDAANRIFSEKDGYFIKNFPVAMFVQLVVVLFFVAIFYTMETSVLFGASIQSAVSATPESGPPQSTVASP